MTRQLPFMSVVICVYNRGDVIGRAIESLLAQDYPQDRYEIIVVEDGSVDDSFEVASRYPVTVIRHPRNLGIPAGRNSGMKRAKGDIYVCFDSDCVVAPNWLRTIASGYQQPNVAGIGSIIAPPDPVKGLVERYLVASEAGSAPSMKLGVHAGTVRRFLAYLVDQVEDKQAYTATTPYPVRQLNGATASFPMDVLRAVDGWNESLSFMEDSDISDRILAAFPDRHFYVLPTARLIHDPDMSVYTFLRRPYKRGVFNLRYYRQRQMFPPVFPFPLIWLVASSAVLLAGSWVALAVAVLLPQLMYFWWPYKGLRQLSARYFIFSYMQMAEELCGTLGLLRGVLKDA